MSEDEKEVITVFLKTMLKSFEINSIAEARSMCDILYFAVQGDNWEKFVDSIMAARRDKTE